MCPCVAFRSAGLSSWIYLLVVPVEPCCLQRNTARTWTTCARTRLPAVLPRTLRFCLVLTHPVARVAYTACVFYLWNAPAFPMACQQLERLAGRGWLLLTTAPTTLRCADGTSPPRPYRLRSCCVTGTYFVVEAEAYICLCFCIVVLVLYICTPLPCCPLYTFVFILFVACGRYIYLLYLGVPFTACIAFYCLVHALPCRTGGGGDPKISINLH